MLREIYMRNEDDPKFVPDKVEESEMIEVLIQHLMMLFATSRGEVIAYPEYGMNLEELLFELEIDTDRINEELDYQYSQFIAPYFPGYTIEFDAYENESDMERVLVLDVYINSDLSLRIIN